MADQEQLVLGEVVDRPQRRTGELVSEGTGRIRPRARLIRTIGAELISSEVVAITELVRNCFDADATRVEIHFTDPHLSEVAKLEVKDDGHGMSREVLLGPWLEPATDHKSGSPKEGGFGGDRSPAGRRRLGSKGVGRFAAQRLGSHLTVTTKTHGASTELLATFDWEHLDRADRYLDQMKVPWREVSSVDASWHGTSLSIERLADRWTEERFQRLKLSLGRLLGPSLGTDQFSIFIVINSVEEEIRPAIESTTAMYKLEGNVGIDGHTRLVYRDLAGAEEEWDRTVVWPPGEKSGCGPLEISLKAWDLNREALLYFFKREGISPGMRDFRRLVRDHSGISLYRDGFRILPYGESDNDWLRLDRRRVNNPTLRLSNNQMMGTILLTADENPELRDQTNREGLVANESYLHLQEVVLEILGYFEARRFQSRRSLGIGVGNGTATLPNLTFDQQTEIESILEGLESSTVLDSGKSVSRLKDLIESTQRSASEAVRQYAGLAASGQLAGLVFSQLKHPVEQIRTEISCIVETMEDFDLPADFREDLEASTDKIGRVLARLSGQMATLDPLAIPKKLRQEQEVNLRDSAEEVLNAFSDELATSEIRAEASGKQDTAIETDPFVIRSVMAILLENAIFWLQLQDGRREIKIQVRESGFDIENNGPPVLKEHRDQIFEPHFTTRQDAAGMGLTLCRDLVNTIGGRISLGRKMKGVNFKVDLPR